MFQIQEVRQPAGVSADAAVPPLPSRRGYLFLGPAGQVIGAGEGAHEMDAVGWPRELIQ
jgi:hypothetical protein